MLKRRFGRTDQDVSVQSLGGMRYQQSWRDTGQTIDPESQQNLEDTVMGALDAGINHIETARGYGTSERQLGMLFRKIDRRLFLLQTKISPTPDPTRFRSHVEESLTRLAVDRIDFLSIHGINTYEKFWWTVRDGGCLEVVRDFQRQGRVGSVGFSTHGSLQLITDAINWESADDPGFDYVNLHWYYIKQDNAPAIAAAATRDLGVFIISPTDKGGHLHKPAPLLQKLCEPLHPIEFNSAYCLSNPAVHTLSLGAGKTDELEPAIHADRLLQIATENQLPDKVQLIDARMRAAMQARFGVERPEELTTGLPAWEDTPQYINLPYIAWIYGLWQAWGLESYARDRYSILGNAGDWVPGARYQPLADQQLSRALAKAAFGDQLPVWIEQLETLVSGSTTQRLSQTS